MAAATAQQSWRPTDRRQHAAEHPFDDLTQRAAGGCRECAAALSRGVRNGHGEHFVERRLVGAAEEFGGHCHLLDVWQHGFVIRLVSCLPRPWMRTWMSSPWDAK